MATHTLSSGDFIRPYRNVKCRTFREHASSTFKKGDPLIMSDTAGYEGTRVKALTGDVVAKVVGFAAEDASGVTDARIVVWLATPEAEFRGVVANTTSDGTIDGLNVGLEYGLIADSTNSIWRVDIGDASNKLVCVTELIDPDGDVNGYVAFRVKKYLDAEVTIN